METMTNRSSRSGRHAVSRAITRSTSRNKESIWGTIASYAIELAPVAGPLLAAIGQTAEAIDRAEQRSRCLEAECMKE